MTYLFIVIGLVVLALGAECLVRGSVSVARRMSLSPLMIGLTLVGFGTSSPELVASVTAAVKGSPGIAVGNVVGSNICNVFLILGVAASISPLAISRKAFLRDGPVLLVATALMVVVVLAGVVPRIVGAAFIGLLGAYLLLCWYSERGAVNPAGDAHVSEAEEIPTVSGPLWKGLVVTAIGLALLVGGAYLLVEGAVVLARTYGVSEAVIGLTVVALGTSLPELATSVVAALRNHSDVAFGNVVGSNIYNSFGILGATAVVKPVPVPAEIVTQDIWVMVAASVLLAVFAVSGWRISRWEGITLLALYGAFVARLAMTTSLG